MALLSNSVRLAPFPSLGGNAATSGAHTAERNVYWSTGQRKTFAYGQARIDSVTNRAAVPEGYVHPYCHSMAQKSGGMASRARIVGEGTVNSGNLAGGLNGEADLSGSGSITNAALGLILSAVASLSGSATVAGSIVGVLQAVADLSGDGSITAALGAKAGLAAGVTGSSAVSAATTARAAMSADIVVTGTGLTTANVADAVWRAACETGLTYEAVMRLLVAVAAGKTEIVDLGGGNATVTFRDTNDTRDRIVADMSGSERIDLVLDTDD
mgnify:CR=1 FL=1